LDSESRAPIQDALTRPLWDLRVSVIDRCNFRCGYCMPTDALKVHADFLPRKRLLSDAEIDRLVRAFVDLGIAKIRITGGEPLLRPGLVSLIKRLAGIAGVEDLALISNGFMIAGHCDHWQVNMQEKLRVVTSLRTAQVKLV